MMYFNSIESLIFMNKAKNEEEAFEKIIKENLVVNLELPETRIHRIERVLSTRIGGLQETL